VRAAEHIALAITKAREKPAEAGVPEVIIEKVYRSMIEAFHDYELKQHEQLQQEKSSLAR